MNMSVKRILVSELPTVRPECHDRFPTSDVRPWPLVFVDRSGMVWPGLDNPKLSFRREESRVAVIDAKIIT